MLARILGPHLNVLKRRNASLHDQLKRACTSVASNLSEGRRRIGKDRAHHFRCAEGSAAEVQIQLELAKAYGDLPAAVLDEALLIADRLVGLCYGLTRDRSRGGG